MALNKQKGNMYGFVTHTWNTVKGRCPHDCSYCYMKAHGEQKDLHFDEKELNTDLGEGNFIFVGSSCDMWAESVPDEWIAKTIAHCRKYQRNNYLFQTKNPARFVRFLQHDTFPVGTVLCTTIETNRDYVQMGIAPNTHERAMQMGSYELRTYAKMVTIEPIMDFDIKELAYYICLTGAVQVNIGADSKGHGLPEPSGYKIKLLIEALPGYITVEQKPNLKRIMER